MPVQCDFIKLKPLPYQTCDVYKDKVSGHHVMYFHNCFYIVHDYVINKDADMWDMNDEQSSHTHEEAYRYGYGGSSMSFLKHEPRTGEKVIEGIAIEYFVDNYRLNILCLDIGCVAARFREQVLKNGKS